MLGGVLGGLGAKPRNTTCVGLPYVPQKDPQKDSQNHPNVGIFGIHGVYGKYILCSGEDAVILFQIFQPQPGQQIQDHVEDQRTSNQVFGVRGLERLPLGGCGRN